MSLRRGWPALLTAVLALTACTDPGQAAGPVGSSPSALATPGIPPPTGVSATTAPGSQVPSTSARQPKPKPVVEPTTTNTLPPPPRPSRPAPSTAGRLSARSLPVPAGWRTVARKGGAEAGYQGNGTWVHARDPRYAAHDVITLGCAPVTRDDYPDPTSALEGSYAQGKHGSGIGLVLEFGRVEQAQRYYRRYVQQIRACRDPAGPLVARIVPSSLGLIDRRSYPDGDWLEVGAIHGTRLTLVLLTDPGQHRTRSTAEQILRQITAS